MRHPPLRGAAAGHLLVEQPEQAARVDRERSVRRVRDRAEVSGPGNAAVLRAADADLLDAFLVSAIATLIVIRIFLEATGYPQLGGGGLHIAHVLWGGLGMLAAIVLKPHSRAHHFLADFVQRALGSFEENDELRAKMFESFERSDFGFVGHFTSDE